MCLSLTSGSSEALDDTLEDVRHSAVSASPEPSIAGSTMSASMQHRTNMTMHVCWHRSLSVSSSEHAVAFRVCTESQLPVYYKDTDCTVLALEHRLLRLILVSDPYADVDGVGGGVWVNFHRRRRRADDFKSAAAAAFGGGKPFTRSL